MAVVLGVDEAGRGAALGPLVVAGVAVDEGDLGALWDLGVRDSKLVPRERRPELVRAVACAGARGRAVVVPAGRIDEESLTELELQAAALLIRALAPDRVVVDAPVAPRAIGRFRDALAALSRLDPERIAAFPHADRTDPAAAAASLLAKVVRDGYVLHLRRTYGDFGWGYPGEPKVRAFLEGWMARHGSLPPICRRRWRSVQALLAPSLLERVAGGSEPGENGGQLRTKEDVCPSAPTNPIAGAGTGSTGFWPGCGRRPVVLFSPGGGGRAGTG